MKQVLAAVAAACLLGCSQAPGVNVTPAQPAQPPALAVTTSSLVDPPSASHVGDVRSITVKARVVGLQGSRELSAEFVDPTGQTFSRSAQALSGTAFDEHFADFTLPVAGTLVDSNSMAGRWQVRLLLGSEVVATQAFDLQP